MQLIVTEFFNFNDCDFSEEYFPAILSLQEDVIIFTTSNMVEFLSNNRNKECKTFIVEMKYNELRYFSHNKVISQVLNIKDDTSTKQQVIELSKTSLMVRANQLRPEYSHVVWMDFDMEFDTNSNLFPKGIEDPVKMHCSSKHSISDLSEIEKDFHPPRILSSIISGKKENIFLFDLLLQVSLKRMLDNKSFFKSIYDVLYQELPNIMKLTYGKKNDMLTNYYSIESNRQYVLNEFGSSVFNNKTKTIGLIVLNSDVDNTESNMSLKGAINLINSFGFQYKLFEAGRYKNKNIFLKEELDDIESLCMLICVGGPVVSVFNYDNFVHSLKKIKIPKILIGAGTFNVEIDNYAVCCKFLTAFDHIFTRDDMTYQIFDDIISSKVSKGIDLRFFTGENMNTNTVKHNYCVRNVQDTDDKISKENTYTTNPKNENGNLLSCVLPESFYSLYANSSFVETSDLSEMIICLTEGVESALFRKESWKQDYDFILRKVGVDLQTNNKVKKSQFSGRIRIEKLKFRENLQYYIINKMI